MAQAVLRAMELMTRIAAAAKPMGFNRIENMCPEIAPATLARLIKFLAAEGLLARDGGGGYIIGSQAVVFARALLDGTGSRDALARPVVRRLAERTGESAAYYEMHGDAITLLAKEERPNSFHYIAEGGRTRNLHHHLFSQTITAFSGRKAAEAVVEAEGLSFGQAARFREETDRLAEQGLALGNEEANVAISRAVVPVRGVDGYPVGAIGITALGTDLPRERLETLAAAAREAGSELTRVFESRQIGRKIS